MQIVIDIPDKTYNVIKNTKQVAERECWILTNAILNGKPLPKGHGRLIDADTLECDCFNRTFDDYAFDCIDDAPTIIPADREG